MNTSFIGENICSLKSSGSISLKFYVMHPCMYSQKFSSSNFRSLWPNISPKLFWPVYQGPRCVQSMKKRGRKSTLLLHSKRFSVNNFDSLLCNTLSENNPTFRDITWNIVENIYYMKYSAEYHVSPATFHVISRKIDLNLGQCTALSQKHFKQLAL